MHMIDLINQNRNTPTSSWDTEPVHQRSCWQKI